VCVLCVLHRGCVISNKVFPHDVICWFVSMASSGERESFSSSFFNSGSVPCSFAWREKGILQPRTTRSTTVLTHSLGLPFQLKYAPSLHIYSAHTHTHTHTNTLVTYPHTHPHTGHTPTIYQVIKKLYFIPPPAFTHATNLTQPLLILAQIHTNSSPGVLDKRREALK